jgi:ribosome biogenesis GTPase
MNHIPIEFQPLQAIGLTALQFQQFLRMPPPRPGSCLLRVIELQREGVQLHDGVHAFGARVLGCLHQALLAEGDALAVGDWVLAGRNAHGQWWVQQRVPPLTQIARRLHDGRDKVSRAVIVSNVDTAMLVMGLDMDFSVRRLERYVALAQGAGVDALVVLSKADLCTDIDARLRDVRTVLPATTPAQALNALDPACVDALAPWLGEGHTLVLLGSSGAGKSTLTNTLLGDDAQRTGPARRGDGRGRHTTTARTQHRTAFGACIIDTPGLRTLRLDADEDALAASFEDIDQLRGACRFRDCTHRGEPGCAVREQVAPERVDNYHKLLREAQRDTMSALQRREQLVQWKSRSRHARMRMQAKRG